MNKRIIVALDSNNINKTKYLVTKLKNEVFAFKIGYEFFLNFGLNGYNDIKNICSKIFLDLKLHDIPNTCVSTVKAIKDLRVNYLTIHISAGLEALRATKNASGNIKLIGITTLTSLDNKGLKEIGYNKNINKLVIHQAKLATKANLDALVCSPHEVKHVRKFFKKEIITPGIRYNSHINDQKRVMTPKQAFKNGSDWLVVGRPITNGNIKNNLKKLINHLNN